MRKVAFLFFMAVFFTFFFSIQIQTASAAPDNSPITTVEVNNVADLISNIKSNSTIILDGGEYNLGKALDSLNPAVWYDYGAKIGNVSNLEIRAADNATVLLYSNRPDDAVLAFDSCTGISVKNITLGHVLRDVDSCSAGVVNLYNSTNIMFDQCDVFGCGYFGFEVDSSSGVGITGCCIHHCKEYAVGVYDSSNVTVSGSTIINNDNESGDGLFNFYSSTNVKLTNSIISSNGCATAISNPMFDYDDTDSSFYLTNCTVSDNYYTGFCSDALFVRFDSKSGSAVAGKITGASTSITAPAAPTRAGYTFSGWYKDISYTTAWNFATDKVSTNITLFAKWTPNAPAVPKSVKAVSASYKSIKLTWTAAPFACGYEISRATASAGSYSFIANVTASSYTDATSTLITGKVYYYKVRAYRLVDGSKLFGNSCSAVSAMAVPATPTGVTAARVSPNSVRIAWTAVVGANGYEVRRCTTSATGTYSLLITVGNTYYTNTGLTTGKTYWYKVRAYRLVGNTMVYSNYSVVVYAKP